MKLYLSLVVIHTVLISFALFLPLAWLDSGTVSNWVYTIAPSLRTATTVLMIFYFYAYRANKHFLFILPLSFAPLIFIILPMLSFSRVGNLRSLYIFNDVLFFSLLFGFITLIVSIILQIKKSKRHQQNRTLYKNETTPRRIMIAGSVLAGLYIISLIIFLIRHFIYTFS